MELAALFDNDDSIRSPFADVPLFFGAKGFEHWLKNDKGGNPIGFFVTMGGERGEDRVAIHNYLAAKGLVSLTAVHRTAFVADSARIGEGSQIMAHATVCVDAVMGRSCLINTGATVDHECRLGAGVHIAPGANLASCVEVGDYATVFTGAVVLPRIKIGRGAIVGAGAVVIRDVPAGTTVVGNPARRLPKKVAR